MPSLKLQLTIKTWLKSLLACLLFSFAVSFSIEVNAEYGDVVLNNFAEKAGMRPVIFPHWFHRMRYRCRNCHGELGFAMKAGKSGINMPKIMDGQYCGACHNGDVAWAIDKCDLCHSGKKGMSTHVDKGATESIATPNAK